jgi:hypothetical protein
MRRGGRFIALSRRSLCSRLTSDWVSVSGYMRSPFDVKYLEIELLKGSR